MTDQAVIDELSRIAESHDGELRAEDVVSAARAKASPLHSKFTWENNVAAHQYRLWQARTLIRVTVQFIGPKEDQTSVRVFVSLSSDRTNRDGGGYRSLVSVMSNQQQRAQLLEDAFEEMKLFREKYAGLQELVKVFAAMRKVQRKKL